LEFAHFIEKMAFGENERPEANKIHHEVLEKTKIYF
jgi:hypothetical protein